MKTGTDNTGEGIFRTTQWDDIQALQTQHAGRQATALERVLGNYWRPLYIVLRHKGYSHENAEDILQAFVEEKVLRKQVLLRASPQRGRFRTFLLTSLLNYARSEHRASTASKRCPAEGLISLDALIHPNQVGAGPDQNPIQVFTAAWVTELLCEVLQSLRTSCHLASQPEYWEVFRRTVVDPLLHNTEPPSMETLCHELAIESERKASNMNVTMKRRFQATLRGRLRQCMGPDEDVDTELADLRRVLAHTN